MSLSSFFGGASANAGLQRSRADRQFKNRQLEMLEREEGRILAGEKVSQIANLARDLGVAIKAGEQIDVPKLTALLDGQRKSGKIDPKLSQLAALVGNEDLATKQNEGFSWKQFTISPDGSGLTMAGTYDGDSTLRFATEGGNKDPNAEVVFSDAGEVAALLGNQYNQVWNQPGAAAFKNELNLKNNLIDSEQSIKDNEAKIATAVGQLTNEVEAAIIQIGGENGPAVARKMKEALAGLPYDQQLEILREQAGNLSLDTADIITPDVEKAAVEEKQGGEPDAPEQADAPDDSGSDVAALEARLARLEGKSGRGVADRRAKVKKEIAEAKAAQKPAPQSPAETPIKDENPEIQSTAEAAEAATDEEIVAGKVKVTPEGIKALKEKLEAKGIKTLEDMNKATRAEQQYMRAMLSTIAANTDQREDYMTRMQNVMATGNADFDSKTLGEAILSERAQEQADYDSVTKRGVMETGKMNAQRLQTEMFETFRGNQGTFIGGKVKKISDLFVDKDGEPQDVDKDTYMKAAIGPGGAISSLWGKTKEQLRIVNDETASSMQKKTARQQLNMLQQALLAQISFGMQFLSQDGGLELSMATDSGAPLSGNDSALSRVARDGNGYIIVKPGSKDKDGDGFTGKQLAEFFSDKELKAFFDEKLTEISSRRGY
jgi:hypothetical protein